MAIVQRERVGGWEASRFHLCKHDTARLSFRLICLPACLPALLYNNRAARAVLCSAFVPSPQ